jgi:hypothetical protein
VHRLATVICGLAVVACAPTGASEERVLKEHSELQDTFLNEFDRHHLISDRAFFDELAVTTSEVQAFLEHTPYGHRNFLADEVMADGRTFAEALTQTAVSHDVNPLVLLATLQKETSMVSAETRPSAFKINFAMGCGCPDGQGCNPTFKGLDKQIKCLSKSFLNHKNDLMANGQTLTGWRPGKAKNTLDPNSVNPANRATAILYTYTPWVLRGQGGNWAFWRIWTRFADHAGYQIGLNVPFNEGFIGGRCSSTDDCFGAESTCLFDDFSGVGRCTQSCTSLCPDRPGLHYATTFCVPSNGGGGKCVAQCPFDGCDHGMICVQDERFGDPNVSTSVCAAAP